MARLQIPLASVGLSGLQGARLSSVDNGGEALARGLQQVGNVAQNIYLQEREEQDKRMVLERTNGMRDKLNETWTFIETEVQGAKIKDPVQFGGKAGQSLTDRFTEVADELRREFSTGLTERQLAAFDQSVLPAMTALRSNVRQHESKQWVVLEESEAKAAHMKNAALVAAAPTRENIEAGVTEAVRLAGMDAKRVGLDKTAAEMHQLSSTSAVVAPALEKLLRRDSEQAKVLFQQYAPLLTPKDRERLDEDLDTAITANRARVLGNQASEKFGFDLVAARKWIEGQVGEDAKLRGKADAEYHDLVNIARSQMRLEDEEAAGSVFDAALKIRNGGRALTTSQISRLVMDAGISGKDRFAVEKQLEYLFRGDPQEKALAREARSEQRAVKMIEYLTNPDKLAGMSEKQVYALVPEVGPENALSLARMKKTMQSQAGDLELPAPILSAVIKQTGMNPNKGSDAKIIGAARESAANEILASQKARGRALDDQEKAKILNKHFRLELVPGFFGSSKTLYGAADLSGVVKELPMTTKQAVMKVAERAGLTKMVGGVQEFAGTPAQFLAIRDDLEQFAGKKGR